MPQKDALSGLLNVAKPAGCTSRDVVNRVLARAPRRNKAGHAGTLDPLARGVLVVCLGAATRLASYVQAQPKTYRGRFLLGLRSDTEDVEGAVEQLPDAPVPVRVQLEAAAARWTGEVLQRPPAYSALKVAGKRAHDLARSGVDVELAPRPVRIDAIDLLRYDYPELEMRVRCGAGAYLRSLGRDLAEACGTSAVMEDLVRESVGDWLAGAGGRPGSTGPRDRERTPTGSRVGGTGHLPQVVLPEELLPRIACGALLSDDQVGSAHSGDEQGEVAGVSPSGDLVAVFARLPQGWKPAVNLIGR